MLALTKIYQQLKSLQIWSTNTFCHSQTVLLVCKKTWGRLTSFYAVLHQVSIQTSSSDGFWRTPLYGHCGVGDIVYNQHGGLTGHSWGQIIVWRSDDSWPSFLIFPLWILIREKHTFWQAINTWAKCFCLYLAGMLSTPMLDLISPCSYHLFLYCESYLVWLNPLTDMIS